MPAVDRPGTPNGPYLAARLRERARPLHLQLRVEVHAYVLRSSHGVQVAWDGPDGAVDLLCEVSERFDAVTVTEHDRELTVDQAVDYVLARASGTSPQDALAIARPPRRHWGSRR